MDYFIILALLGFIFIPAMFIEWFWLPAWRSGSKLRMFFAAVFLIVLAVGMTH